jgi:hypothetical protein
VTVGVDADAASILVRAVDRDFQLAQLAWCLAADESSFTIGQIPIIDGGWID